MPCKIIRIMFIGIWLLCQPGPFCQVSTVQCMVAPLWLLINFIILMVDFLKGRGADQNQTGQKYEITRGCRKCGW